MTDLLGTLPSATFEKEPESAILLCMTTPLPTTWSVGDEDDILSIRVGSTEEEYDLTTLTLSQLRLALSAVGLSGGVVEWNGSASLLTPGQSGSATAGGIVPLYGYTNPLWAIIRPYERELRIARASSETHQEQMILQESQGYWIDYWGSYFGVARRSGELDAPYIQRIIDEVFRARNTLLAIEGGIEDSLGYDVQIYEPWKRVFTLSQSRLSGRDHLHGDYYRYHIIHPRSDQAVDWDLVEEQIHLLRPAGTLIWESNNWAPPAVLDDLDLLSAVAGDHWGTFQNHLILAGGQLSKNLTLSKDHFFLRIMPGPQITCYAAPATVSLFYPEGDPKWDSETWTSYGATTWRERSAVAAPILAQHSVINSAISEFAAMAVIAGNGLWQATGYFPEIFLDDESVLDREELHAAALSFGDFS